MDVMLIMAREVLRQSGHGLQMAIFAEVVTLVEDRFAHSKWCRTGVTN